MKPKPFSSLNHLTVPEILCPAMHVMCLCRQWRLWIRPGRAGIGFESSGHCVHPELFCRGFLCRLGFVLCRFCVRGQFALSLFFLLPLFREIALALFVLVIRFGHAVLSAFYVYVFITCEANRHTIEGARAIPARTPFHGPPKAGIRPPATASLRCVRCGRGGNFANPHLSDSGPCNSAGADRISIRRMR